MSRIHVACVGYSGAPEAYWRGLDTMELPAEATAAASKTHLRWRGKAPATARFVPHVAPELVASGFHGEAAEAAWTRTREVAERLAADTVLLRTPSSFRPTRENRDALSAFFSGSRAGDLRVAWWAEGLWEGQPEDRDKVCTRSGLIPVVDPLALDEDEEAPDGPFFYWRLRGRPGSGTRFSEHDFDTLLGLAAERGTGYVVFTSGWMMGDARRFAVMAGMAADAAEEQGDDDADDDDGPDEDE